VILVDTSVWIQHLGSGSAGLVRALEEGDVLTHPFVVGELACGMIANRQEVMSLLRGLPAATVASDDETLAFIEARSLMARGIGYLDVDLLASAALSTPARLWTLDRRLAAVARDLELDHEE
jgi:predicted nucleic acid-binding protein